MNRRRKSRPDKAPATVAVQDTEQESTIYQFLKKSREDSATDFVKFDFINPHKPYLTSICVTTVTIRYKFT